MIIKMVMVKGHAWAMYHGNDGGGHHNACYDMEGHHHHLHLHDQREMPSSPFLALSAV